MDEPAISPRRAFSEVAADFDVATKVADLGAHVDPNARVVGIVPDVAVVVISKRGGE